MLFQNFINPTILTNILKSHLFLQNFLSSYQNVCAYNSNKIMKFYNITTKYKSKTINHTNSLLSCNMFFCSAFHWQITNLVTNKFLNNFENFIDKSSFQTKTSIQNWKWKVKWFLYYWKLFKVINYYHWLAPSKILFETWPTKRQDKNVYFF